MALSQKSYWFRPGRLIKSGRKNPGILAVEDKYEFVAHEGTKDGNSWFYCCKYRLTPKIKCPAKARVMRFDDKWILQHADDHHNCEPNRPKVTAELLRNKMKHLVRKDPAKAVGKAVRAVRIEAAKEFSEDADFYQHLVAELGTDSALEKQLLRVRAEIIGPTPRSRNMFDPINFMKRIFGDTNDVVCDSNNLEDGWRKEIDKANIGSDYDWSKLNEEMLNMEELHTVEEEVLETDEEIESSQALDNDIELDNLSDKDLPKRVLAFTSVKLLQLLGSNLKSSVDGTFKSSCSLWTQQFIWMVKLKGYWIPAVWGWLPDKTEVSYKVFFLLLQKKMEELGMQLNVESVLSDFELNILKSVDVMLQCPILGCFFHHKKCIQRRVDRNGFKTRYENDENFNSFINQCSSLSHLPIGDIEDGLKYIEEKFVFEDEKAEEFKADLIKYMRDFWINGCLPPRVWNTFGRSEDLTNNNQEGYNSKFNKELKETHPSPGILLCHVKDQITLAEEKVVRVKAAVPKPAQRKTYKNLAKTRLRLKKNYLDGKERGEKSAVSDFLCSMGHNVKSATMTGRVDEYEESHSKDSCEADENDVSSWVPSFENSVLEELQCEDPYSERRIGEKKKVAWRNKKCPSCKLGFNTKSDPVKCDGCDSFTHKKNACLDESIEKHQFYCKICKPTVLNKDSSKEPSEIQPSCIQKIDNGFKCGKCGLVAKSNYSIKRHIERKHQEREVENDGMNTEAVKEKKEVTRPKAENISELLEILNLCQYKELLEQERIDLDMLLKLNPEELMDMFRDIGILPWGHRHQIRKALENYEHDQEVIDNMIEEEVIDNTTETEITVSDIVEIVDSYANEEISNEEMSSGSTKHCGLCEESSQHDCTLCGKRVCNFCSEADQNSSNEMKRQHKADDPRCHTVTNLECPSCDNKFKSQSDLEIHITTKHDLSTSMPSLLSEADDSSWKYVTCEECNGKFENEQDLLYHEERVHEYGESGNIYPCDQCGYQGPDIVALKNHTEQAHKKSYYNGRIKQNLHNINFDDDSDEDVEWNPTLDDKKELAKEKKKSEPEKDLSNKKRKVDPLESQRVKKIRTEHICAKCDKSFSRKDGLQRHLKNICNI